MLLLPHGSYLHLSRVFACLAGLACSDYELQMGGLRAFVQGVSAMAASAAGRARVWLLLLWLARQC